MQLFIQVALSKGHSQEQLSLQGWTPITGLKTTPWGFQEGEQNCRVWGRGRRKRKQYRVSTASSLLCQVFLSVAM